MVVQGSFCEETERVEGVVGEGVKSWGEDVRSVMRWEGRSGVGVMGVGVGGVRVLI